MNNSQCAFYRLFKETHRQENYLALLSPNQRIYLSKFRTRTNHLPITKARFHNDEANVYCPLCPGENVGDELHYLFQCDYFKVERNELIPHKFMKGSPSANVIELFSCDAEENTLKNVACFVKKKVMNKFTYTNTHPQDKEIVDKRPKKSKPPEVVELSDHLKNYHYDHDQYFFSPICHCCRAENADVLCVNTVVICMCIKPR